MRQRLLNGALAGALAALFCLLAATAYTEVKQGRAEAGCAFENHILERQAARCENCASAACGTGAATTRNCGEGASCATDGKAADLAPKSTRTGSRPRAGMPMQP
ncbi:hypothetical protein CN311_08250 [Mesorhizobium sanjuanii]|uniref:Uncharacterized protein n=1 Tax=Mesorhizobium sanjuanii TaxID=2037900 RepID=A0A2A6FIQ8_9HYPH|nr:hypothetical protein [Mesorhizobium sanjuanii]PDQ21633.1 hypothetical protein CN311_08250 [Mesorhizobium sanjuanii]